VDNQRLTEELKVLIEGYLKEQGLELVEFTCRYEGRDLVLRILADRPEGGITLEECAGINANIGSLLDERGVLQQPYLLEVSSPGIDRPMKTKKDFLRQAGKEARILLREPVNGKWEMQGAIKGADDNSVYIDIQGSAVEVPLSKISKATQVV
jgi:ribosome maturation factor RimP